MLGRLPINFGYVREVGIAKWAYRTLLRQISERVLRRDNYLRLPTGLEIRLPRDLSASEIFVTNASIDWGAEALLTRWLEPTGIFLDVGAHIGYYSLYVLPRVARVFAFEPDPRNLPALESNLREFRNATVVPRAVSNVAGEATFVLTRETSTSRLLKPGTVNVDATATITVQTITLDEFMKPVPGRVTGITTDVEGSDLDVLKGAEHILHRDAPLVLSELPVTDELLHWTSQVGYSIYGFAREQVAGPVHFHRFIARHTLLTKMLFLVPTRLESEFRRLAGISPEDDGSRHSPASSARGRW